jgi:DNA-binding transcriptional MerR regulator
MDVPTLKDYITENMAAKRLGICAATMKRWASTRRIKFHINPYNGRRMYLPKDVDAILESIDRLQMDVKKKK